MPTGLRATHALVPYQIVAVIEKGSLVRIQKISVDCTLIHWIPAFAGMKVCVWFFCTVLGFG